MVAKTSRRYIQDKKKVLILVPKKEFFPLITQELSKRGIAHNCPASFLPKRVEIAKLFIDWVKNPSDNFRTRRVVEELINNGIAKVPGRRKDRKCRPETIEKRIEEEIEIAKLWERVDKKNNLFSVIENLEKPNETLIKIKVGLSKIVDSYTDFESEKQGEFVKQLSVISGIWCDPSKLAEDISKIIKLLDSQLSTALGWVQLKTMRKAKGLEADVVIIAGLEDDIVPNHRSDLAEEARLFYVSMTRAKEDLLLFHSYKRPRNISYGQNLTDKKRSRVLDVIGRKSEWRGRKKKKGYRF